MHVVGVSSLAAGHLTLMPALRDALAELGADDVLIVVGGVIPPDDVADAEGDGRGGGVPARHGHRRGGAGAAPHAVRTALATEAARSTCRPWSRGSWPATGGWWRAPSRWSSRAAADHRERAQELLVELLPHAGGARRVGISGVPGVGKSTFIDQLGVDLTAAGLEGRGARRRPVVGPLGRFDPGRQDPHGPAVGRSARLHPALADLRHARRGRPGDPRVDGGRGGGRLRRRPRGDRRRRAVGDHRRRDGRLVPVPDHRPHRRPAAGHQDAASSRSPTSSRSTRPTAPGAADARKAARELAGAIRMLRGQGEDWEVPVLTCAGLTGEGLDEVWAKLVEHQDRAKASGAFEERRRAQQVRWTWQLVRDALEHRLARASGGALDRHRDWRRRCWPGS